MNYSKSASNIHKNLQRTIPDVTSFSTVNHPITLSQQISNLQQKSQNILRRNPSNNFDTEFSFNRSKMQQTYEF